MMLATIFKKQDLSALLSVYITNRSDSRIVVILFYFFLIVQFHQLSLLILVTFDVKQDEIPKGKST